MLAVALLAVVLTVTLAVAQLGAAVVARHRAQAAADLGALAAAMRLTEGQAGACAAADAVVAANRGYSGRCSVHQLDVVVIVEVPVNFGRWGAGRAVASARAGPIQP